MSLLVRAPDIIPAVLLHPGVQLAAVVERRETLLKRKHGLPERLLGDLPDLADLDLVAAILDELPLSPHFRTIFARQVGRLSKPAALAAQVKRGLRFAVCLLHDRLREAHFRVGGYARRYHPARSRQLHLRRQRELECFLVVRPPLCVRTEVAQGRHAAAAVVTL